MASYFDHYASVNDLSPRGRRGHWRHLDLTLGPHLPHPQGQPRVVDIGCGAGILLEWLRERGYPRACGVDIDAGQVDFARGLGLDATRTDDVTGWLEGRQADVVVLKDVLEHLEEAQAEALLRTVARQLAPGGIVYLTVPNAGASFASYWRYVDGTHLRSYTAHSLRWRLAGAGLELQHLGSDDVWAAGSALGHLRLALRRAFRLLRRLEALAEFGHEGLDLPLGLNLVAVARAAVSSHARVEVAQAEAEQLGGQAGAALPGEGPAPR